MARLIFAYPVFGLISQYLHKYATDQMPTMGVAMKNNHKFDFIYNQDFVDKTWNVGEKTLFYLLIHEFLHIALGHVYYKFGVHSKLNKELFNIAADIVVQQHTFDINSKGEKIKGCSEFWVVTYKTGERDKDGNELCQQELLLTRWIDLWEALEKAIDKHGAENIVEFEKGGPNYAQNYGFPEGKTLEEYYLMLQKKFPTMEIYIDDVGKLSFGLAEGHQNWGKEELDNLKKEITNSIQRAIKNGDSSMWGNLTGDAIEEIKSIYNNEIAWFDYARMFTQSIIKEKRSNSRKIWNRKFGNEFPGKKRERVSNLICALDVSGSMSSEELEYCVGSMNSLTKMLGVAIQFIQFDTEIKSIDKSYKPLDKQVKIKGRGGTCPQCVMNYTKEKEKNADGLILFTDGEFGEINQNGTPKTLWIFTRKSWNNSVKGYKTGFGKAKTLKL